MAWINPAIAATFAPPVMEARRWLEGVVFPPDRPLLNVSQAAPVDPPPEPLRAAIADAALNRPEAHLYGPVLGNPELRAAVAAEFGAGYRGRIASDQVAITQGCNQAFCAAVTTLAGAGDEVILPTPWYFNHKMWLDMAGIRAVPLPCGADMLPDPDRAAGLIGPTTRAIVLVTPNNPSGAEYPGDLVGAFFELAQRHGIALIIDETYRDFDSRSGPPHDLLARPGWDETLIQLYSFSKAYRLTGHRVGALTASVARMAQIEKFLDSVAISTSQLGQIGALWGMTHLRDWLAGERAEILARRAATEAALAGLPGWQLRSAGAYFAWVGHPFRLSSVELAPKMLREAGILALPGTMFTPAGDPSGARHLRLAFANVDRDGIAELARRLAGLRA
ncbi:aminotransferase [Paracoccus siganidrum]|uniref:aspartate transaminase n=1 Tax=Paracoccus siganidrum TaxID=1276757 RepID=A0A419ABS0_9RHOB|nr:aminotransferase [Paracoccus siganidrum]RJL21190.1 aminotransferase [Paracoccus siganidrum]RMC40538.1 aminotransferase [Paracoccus siganidrum]